MFSTWTSHVQCQEKRISQFQNPLASLEARCSASINGISLCGLGGQKLYNGENAAFWVKCGLNADPFLGFCGRESLFSLKFKSSLKSQSMIVHFMHWLYCLFPEHHQSIHSILPAVSLRSCLCVTFNYVLHQLNQALICGICGLSSEMRPKCGPFPQFRILRVESNLGNKVMDGTLHLLRRHLNQHHDTPRSSMDCAYTLKL